MLMKTTTNEETCTQDLFQLKVRYHVKLPIIAKLKLLGSGPNDEYQVIQHTPKVCQRR